MIKGRQFHSCGTVLSGGSGAQMSGIVAAGSGGTYLSSTEILDLSTGNNERTSCGLKGFFSMNFEFLTMLISDHMR